jgi:hypothetical protein
VYKMINRVIGLWCICLYIPDVSEPAVEGATFADKSKNEIKILKDRRNVNRTIMESKDLLFC